MSVKWIIDTDPGQDIDDLLALAFALRRPELDIRAITTVTYPSEERARLVLRLLRHLDRRDIPVAAGAQWPMSPVPDSLRKRLEDLSYSMNHASFAEPRDPGDTPGAEHAADLIIRTVEAHPGEIGIAAIAPLTNIATALTKRPDIAGAIRHIAWMGGETTLNRIEHNAAYDYLATEIVLSSGIPLFMGTWDVTRRFVLGPEDCALFHADSSPLNQALGRAIDDWRPAQPWKPNPVMYDIFPFAWSIDPSLYTFETCGVSVETRGEYTRGMTVLRGDAPSSIAVTTRLDEPRIRKLYLETLFSGISTRGNALTSPHK